MATLSKIEDDLSSLPAATIKAPAAESVLIVGDSAALLSPTADYLQTTREVLSRPVGLGRLHSLATEYGLLGENGITLSHSPAATIKTPAAESVLIVGDSAALLSPTADYLQRARDALSQNIGADLTYRSIVTDMRMLEPLRLGAGSVLHTGGLGAKEAMLTIDAASSLAGLGSLAEKIERPLQELALCFGDFARSAETAARQFIETARLSNFAGLGDMLLSPAERAAIADMGQPNRLARQVIEGFNADEQRAAWPPPQSGNFGIQPAQPEPLGGDLLAIAHDILSGRVNSREQVVKRLLMIEQGSQQPPQWEYIEMIALDYEHNGHRYQNMTAFAAKYRLSRATVDNYLKHYEAATGKQVRPGQGRAKRGGKWQQ